MSIHRLALLFSAALLSGAQLARADYSANASCGAGIPAGRSGGIGTYWTSSGASSATISWIRDATNLDDTPLSGGPFRSIQYKFDLDSGGNPVGRTFDPLNSVIGTGRFGSTTAHTANGTSGQSRVAPFLYTASWTCTATARPGTPPAGSTAKAYGYTTGSDPWYLTPTDINQFTGGSSTFDLRIPFSMNLGTAFQTGCSVSYDVAYETAAGTTDLMRIDASGLGVNIWSNPALSMGLQSIASLDADPNTAGASLSFAALASALQADLADGHLDLAHSLALNLNGLPAPSGLIPGTSSAAAVHVSSSAYCGAENPASPTPGTATLLLLGAALGARRKRS